MEQKNRWTIHTATVPNEKLELTNLNKVFQKVFKHLLWPPTAKLILQ
jgi:hypothetical protein